MKILFLQWNAYLQRDIEKAFVKLGTELDSLSYAFQNPEEDPVFCRILRGKLDPGGFDAVFSVNYFPVAAKVCHERGLPYLAWCYDSPLHIMGTGTLPFDTNYIFLFDRGQYLEYKKGGFTRVFHMPLAVDSRRLEELLLSPRDRESFSADISFVGRLYPTNMTYLKELIPEYYRGYFDGICEVEERLPEAGLLYDMITEEFARKCGGGLPDKGMNKGGAPLRQNLILSLATYLTQKRRLEFLAALSKRYRVKLYTTEDTSALPGVVNMGTAFYYSDMPKIFKLSAINLNITFRAIRTGIPLRVLDILGAGGFLMTDWQEEMGEYFEPGEDLVVYWSADELLEKADFYLKNGEERERIARNGHEKAARYYDLTSRISSMLRTAGIL